MSRPLQTMRSLTAADAQVLMREISTVGAVASDARRQVFVVIRRASRDWSGWVWSDRYASSVLADQIVDLLGDHQRCAFWALQVRADVDLLLRPLPVGRLVVLMPAPVAADQNAWSRVQARSASRSRAGRCGWRKVIAVISLEAF